MLASARSALCLLSLFSLFSWTAGSQGLPPCTSSRLDSLLVAGDANGAARYLIVQPQDTRTTAEYSDLIGRLKAALTLPDSVVLPIMQGAHAFKDKFEAVNAGGAASACYDEFMTLHNQKQHAAAYERYVLAQFLRLRHVQCERRRLRGNLDRARQALKNGQLEETRALIALFKTEPMSIALSSSGDTLSRHYANLADELESADYKQEYESSRQLVSPTLLVAVGGNLLLSKFSLEYKQLSFHTGDPAEANVSQLTGNAFSMTPLGFSLDLAYFLSPSLALGFSYQRSGATQEGTVASRIVVKYRAEMRSEFVGAWLKYTIDPREGARPYATIGGGYGKSVLIPEEVSPDPSRVYVLRMEERSMHLGAELGAEYVLSPSIPLCLQGFAQALMNLGSDRVLLKRMQLQLGIRLGYLI